MRLVLPQVILYSYFFQYEYSCQYCIPRLHPTYLCIPVQHWFGAIICTWHRGVPLRALKNVNWPAIMIGPGGGILNSLSSIYSVNIVMFMGGLLWFILWWIWKKKRINFLKKLLVFGAIIYSKFLNHKFIEKTTQVGIGKVLTLCAGCDKD